MQQMQKRMPYAQRAADIDISNKCVNIALSRRNCMKEKIRAFFRKQAKEAAKRKRKYAALKNSDGTKIRVQYFNIPIFIMLGAVIAPILFLTPAASIKNKEPLFSYDLLTTLGALVIILLPFVLLSLLNRFFFGKTVCVFSDNGIRLIDDFIKWSEIKEISYMPGGLGKHRYNISSVDIYVSKQGRPYSHTVSISHFPLYGLRLMKKHLPEAKFDLTFIWIVLAIPAALGLLTALVILLGK